MLGTAADTWLSAAHTANGAGAVAPEWMMCMQEILRVLAGAMGLPDPTSEDLFDTAFSVAEGVASSCATRTVTHAPSGLGQGLHVLLSAAHKSRHDSSAAAPQSMSKGQL